MSTRVRILVGLVILFAAPAFAQVGPLTVTLDTSKLMGSQSGPFYLGFELADGSLTGDGNNAVVISNAQLPGGGPVPPSCAANGQGASGDLWSDITLTDLGSFTYCYQAFVPGSSLSFNVSYTNNLDPAEPPDEFVMVILDNRFQPIPTTGGVAFLQIDFDSANPNVQTFPGDPTQPEAANGGSGIAIPAPIVSGFLPSAPALISPANESTGGALKTQLSWSGATGATSYDVYFGTSSPPPFVTNTTSTSYAPGTLNLNTTYYWQVVAKNSGGSAGSPIFSFFTISSLCTFSVSQVAGSVGPAGGPASMLLGAAGFGCVWTATSNAFWLHGGSSGAGNGVLFLTADPNAGTARLGTVSFANQTITVMQGGSVTDPIFNDVPSTDPYFDYVSLLYEGGITAGCSSSPPLYCPSTPVTRAQMAVFIVAALDQAMGTSLTYSPTAYFQDVPSSSIYFPFVQRIADLGITAGCSTNPPMFCPDMSIPQGQMAVFMIVGWMLANNVSSFTYTPTPYFTDVPPTDIYFKFVQKMRDLGFWTGCSPTLYCETSAVTRDQMAPMIMRSLLGAP